MQLPQIAIQRPVLTVMMSLALVLFGVIGLLRLPVRELPNIDPPIVSVQTVFPGANAAVVETEITERLEDELNSIEGIRTLTSESLEQVSNITIEFNLARPIDVCAQDVRDRVARVRGRLPEDIEEPIIAKQEADAQPVMWIALHSNRYDTLELSRLAETQLKDVLQTVTGVSQIVIGGEKRFAIRIWLDARKMAARGVTVLDVQRALKEQNVELPSGRVENLDREMTIETLGEMKTAEQFNRLVIRSEGASLVRLRDIGEAKTGPEDLRSVGRYNGKPAVALGVVKQTQANTIEVARGIKAELERQRAVLPQGVELSLPYDESEYVSHAVSEVWVTLAIAFGLVVIVIYVFLRNFRSTLIPTVAIPVSIIGTFAALHFFGYSINILTMLALVLSIGIVVDDAIVVLENIHRYVEQGLPPLQAAKKAMDEIAFAILAITFSLVAVFTPLAFQTTTTGRLLLEFAATVVVSVIISAFVALTLTPMMAARVLKAHAQEQRPNVALRFFERFLDRITRTYERWLDRALRYRFRTLAVGVVSFLGAIWLFGQLEKDFLPEEDKGRLFNVVVAPEGSTSEYTDRQVAKMEEIVRSFPETDSYFAAVGLSRGGPGDPASGLMFIKFKEGKRRSVQDIVGGPRGMQARFFGEIEGALAFAIVPKAIGRGFGQSLTLQLQNQDLGALATYAGALANRLRGEGYLLNVRSVFQIDKPQLQVSIDRDRAAALGVSIEEVSRTMQILFGGLDLSKVKRDGKEYDVIVQLARESRLTPRDLDGVYVRSRGGQLVQLASVVNTQAMAAPGQINHYNRLRSAEIQATPVGVPIGTAVDRVEAILREDLPPGFRYEWSGEARDLKDTGGQVVFVLILALIIIYMVLAAQFESLIHPITVILTVPLAAIGALGALWLLSWVNFGGTMLHGWTHYAPDAPGWAHALARFVPRIPAMNINLFSQIGLILLVGLVTKNAILLVEFANQQAVLGKNPREAMRAAGLTRLRPILMTSFATIAGILPIAIGFGAGAESRRPMGVAVVGGMLTSTLLTLLIVPVVYTLFADAAAFLRRSRRETSAPEGAAVEGAAPSAP